MGELIKVKNFELCSICHKREATLLCDFPIGRIKNFHMRLPNGLTDYENSFKEYAITCDKRICSKCAVDIGNGLCFCKDCYEKIRKGEIK